MYPASATCDSLDFAVNSETLMVEEGDTAGLFIVKTNDKELFIQMANDDSLIITDSKNVFKYENDKIKFALATGWIDEGMSDVQIAERFADQDFISYLGTNLTKEFENKVYLKDWEYSMHPMDMDPSMKYVPLKFNVVNGTPYDISGEDYDIEIVVNYLRVAGTPDQKKIVKGEDVSANSSIAIKYNLVPVYDEPGLFQDIVSQKIVLKMAQDEILQKYFIPSGNEYKSYLYSKTQEKP